MKERFDRWRYLGQDKESYYQHVRGLDMGNLRTMRGSTTVMAAIALFCAILFLVGQEDWLRFCIFLFVFLLCVGLNIVSALRLRIKNPPKGELVRTLIAVFSAILYLLGILVGTVYSEGDLGVIIIWLFLFVQLAYDIPPLQNLLTVLPAAALFCCVGTSYKTSLNHFYDMAHTFISVTVGLFMSYNKAKLALSNIIVNSMLKKSNYALYHSSTTDELTGLPNRRQMFERIERLTAACKADGRYLCLAVLDVDNFKLYNDRYGHPAGDRLLQGIGLSLRAFQEETGIWVGRIGGEEFLAVWASEEPSACPALAEELRRSVGKVEVIGPTLPAEPVTVSLGLAVLPPQRAEEAYALADKALYRAKDAGKDRTFQYIVSSGEFLPATPPDID